MKRTARESLFERLVAAGHSCNERGPMETPCWIWHGSRCNKGYGQIWADDRSKRVHIAAWELVKGRTVRRGYTLDHVCRNVACWRPSHMQEVTRAVNTARGNRANPRSTAAARAAKRGLRLKRTVLAPGLVVYEKRGELTDCDGPDSYE